MKGRYDEPREEVASRPPQVLVVDDEPVNVRLVQAYLQAEGLRTCGASNGQDALNLVFAGGIDLVILDVRMPTMSGFDVCRALRKDPACARIPVIFLTAEFNDPEMELEGLEAGADEYLYKPVQRRALIARVKNLIRLADAERDRRLMAQLAHSEKLAAIGQMAAGVAHEINNPLAFILSNLSSLHGYVKDVRQVIEAYRQSPEAGRQMEKMTHFQATLDDIESLISETVEGGERVRNIVQEMKVFSRAEADALLEPVDLAEVAGSSLVLTERELTSKARLIKDLQPAPLARAPKGKLHQVVMNLLVNAMQALETPKTPRDRPHEIRVLTSTQGDEAVLSISDTGCGIPPEQEARIFEPFYTTKPVGVGTGIGLSVCMAVVEKMGGTIKVTSAVGRGSTFEVRIPRATPATSRGERAPHGPATSRA